MTSHGRLTAIRDKLLELEGVSNAAVALRNTVSGAQAIVGYVTVTGGRADSKALLDQLTARLDGEPAPAAVVPVSTIPLTAAGNVDFERLSRIPVLDAAIRDQWKRAIETDSCITEVFVTVEANVPRLRRVPLPAIPAKAVRAASQTRAQSAGSAAQLLDKPAIASGARLEYDGSLSNLQQIFRNAAANPNQGTVTCIAPDGSDISWTWAELSVRAERVLGGLRKRGLRPLDKVILNCEDHASTIVAFWGCQIGGFVPVPLGVSTTYKQATAATEKILNVWRLLDRPLVITGGRLVTEVQQWAASTGFEGWQILDLDALAAGDRDCDWHVSANNDVAILLFTSGSTGIPKGVVQTHSALLSLVTSVTQAHGFSNRDVALNWFPLDHVGGLLLIHLPGAYTAESQVHAPTEMITGAPLTWLNLIDKYRATRTWAPNFAFALVNDHPEELRRGKWDLSCMKFVINGGEAIVARTARQFMRLLEPHGLAPGSMHPAWGMSETCSGMTYADGIHPEGDDVSFVEVGSPIPGAHLRIVTSEEKLAWEGQIGRLQVNGPTVTQGYFLNPALNAQSFTSDGWFETGDLAFISHNRVTITGRSKEVIIINGVNFYCHDIEAVVEGVPGVEVSYSAAFGVRPPGSDSDCLCIAFNTSLQSPEDIAKLKRTVRDAVTRKAGTSPRFLVPLKREQIPKTAIGKIQRLLLKAQFEGGEFDDLWKEVDSKGEAGATLPAFHRRVWIPEQLSASGVCNMGNVLVFAERGNFSIELRRLIGSHGGRCATVYAGTEFEHHTAGEFTIVPSDAGHYQQLFTLLAEQQNLPERMIHCWTYAPKNPAVTPELIRAAQTVGCFSLVRALDAFHERSAKRRDPYSLVVVSNGVTMTSGADNTRVEHGTIPGLLRSMAFESFAQPLLIDLEAIDPLADAKAVLNEIGHLNHNSTHITYRRGSRLIPSFAEVSEPHSPDLTGSTTGAKPIYVIAGGLGGVGTIIARHLIATGKAHVLLVGRTQLPPLDEWKSTLAKGGPLANKIHNYLLLENEGDDFVYDELDITDLAALRTSVKRAEERWQGQVNSVFQLAGNLDFKTHWAELESSRSVEDRISGFESMFHAKLYGTWALSRIAAERPGTRLVAFSSVNAIFGGAGLGAYSAAGSFVDLFTLDFQKTNAEVNCFNWTMWDDTGMMASASGSVHDGSRASGYEVISPDAGLASFLIGMSFQPGQLIVGLDAGNANIRNLVHDSVWPLEQLVAYGGASARTPAGYPVTDRFGTPVPCVVKTSLSSSHGPGVTDAVTATQFGVSAIWRELLSAPVVSIRDSFFAVGGDSLLALRCLNRVEETFGVRVSLRKFVEDPTVLQLAEAIDVEMRRAAPSVPFMEISAEDILSRIDQLSESELDAVLSRISDESALEREASRNRVSLGERR